MEGEGGHHLLALRLTDSPIGTAERDGVEQEAQADQEGPAKGCAGAGHK